MGELDAWGIIHEAQRQECYLRIRENRRLDPFFSRLWEIADLRKPRRTLEFPNADFSERERIKLAYELAESALIFLQTKGCSQLCSCAVSCACVDVRTEEHEFYFRVNDICHLEPEFRETRPTKHWCEEELQHARSAVGSLVSENCSWISVTEVAYNHKTKKIELNLSLDSLSSGRS